MQIVDTHCHVVSQDTSVYCRGPFGENPAGWTATRSLTAEQLLAQMDAVGITRAAVVQASAAYGHDNSYLVDCCHQWPERFVAVAAFDPVAPHAASRLERALGDGIVGVRPTVTGATPAGRRPWFTSRAACEFWGAAEELDVTVCLQAHLDAAMPELCALLDRFPTVRVLLDHLGVPNIASSPAAAGELLAGLGRFPQLFLNLTHRNLEPLRDLDVAAEAFLGPVIEAFGAARIAWGSNCPAAAQSLRELGPRNDRARHPARADKDANIRRYRATPLSSSGRKRHVTGLTTVEYVPRRPAVPSPPWKRRLIEELNQRRGA